MVLALFEISYLRMDRVLDDGSSMGKHWQHKHEFRFIDVIGM